LACSRDFKGAKQQYSHIAYFLSILNKFAL
jgi:hypothetical protein